MEYVVLLTILAVLFLGMLFFVDQFPTSGTQQFAIWLATLVIIFSSIIVCTMIIWDFFTRRKKDMKKVRRRREQLLLQFGELKKADLEKEYEKMFPSAFTKMNRVVDDTEYEADWEVFENRLLADSDWVIKVNPLLDDPNADLGDLVNYEGMAGSIGVVKFLPPFYNSDDSISDEGEAQTLNQIMDDLFGMTRLSKKLFLVKQKGKKVAGHIQDKLQKQEDENVEDIV